MIRGPQRVETARLRLRVPRLSDADAMYARYASDACVTKYLGWPRHRSVDQTRAFLVDSASQWERWPAGPYLIECRQTGRLLGGTGLAFETNYRASTGYVLAKDAWGHGYATEALGRMVDVARRVGLRRLYALCCPEHQTSWRVLEKCGFEREALLRRHTELPNLTPGEPSDVYCYARIFD